MTTISGWASLPEKQTKASYASRKCMVNEANAKEEKKRGMTNPAVLKRSHVNNTIFPLQV